MMSRLTIAVFLATLLMGCGIPKIIRENDDRYLQPGALDSPLLRTYSTYTFKLLGRYRVTHDWVITTPCEYRAYERPAPPGRDRSNFWDVADIYETDGKTWQGSNVGGPPKDFDRWMGSVKVPSLVTGEEGKLVEIGMKMLCEEAWWSTSHYLFIRMRRASVDAVQDEVTAGSTGVPVHWTRRMLNGMEWRVLQVPLDQLRARRLNATGAPYQVWITALGDTGYSIAFSLGASSESMAFPQAHAAFEATFQHLLNSLKVEPLSH